MWGGGTWWGISNVAENVLSALWRSCSPVASTDVTLAGKGTSAGLAGYFALNSRPGGEFASSRRSARVWRTDPSLSSGQHLFILFFIEKNLGLNSNYVGILTIVGRQKDWRRPTNTLQPHREGPNKPRWQWYFPGTGVLGPMISTISREDKLKRFSSWCDGSDMLWLELTGRSNQIQRLGWPQISAA